MLFPLLKHRTAPHHDRIEALLDLTRERFTLEDYVRVLESFYGYIVPFERALMQSPAWDIRGLNLPLRSKIPWLKSDLQALIPGWSGIGLFCQDIPPLNSIPEALGALYVIEGSTLGGKVLSRHFHVKFGLSPKTGLAYFTGYGVHTAARWNELRNFADSIPLGEVDREKASLAACAVFDSFGSWLARELSPPQVRISTTVSARAPECL